MHQYISIPLNLSCTSIGMYHDVFDYGNISIQATIHTNTTAKFPPLVAHIGMYLRAYWSQLVCTMYLVYFGMYSILV